MSSPLSSLDKKKKAMSNPSRAFGKRSMPFRANVDADNKLLDEVSSMMAHEHAHSRSSTTASNHQPSPSTSDNFVTSKDLVNSVGSLSSTPQLLSAVDLRKKATSLANGPTDIDLMQTMIKRITQLEKQTAYYSSEVIEKDRRIKILEEKLSIFKKFQGAEENSEWAKIRMLEEKCGKLQQQIYAMESFLADYGMIWVGDESTSSPTPSDDDGHQNNTTWQLQHAGSKCDNLLPTSVDYNLIVRNIEELNVIAGEGEHDVQHTKDGARLKVRESVPLTLYANGIVMFDGPFRHIDDISTQRCLQDIADGYFPSELHSRYPNGVPIQLSDKRSVMFDDPRHKILFPGVGHSLSGTDVAGKPETDHVARNVYGAPAAAVAGSSSASSGTNHQQQQRVSTIHAADRPRLTADQFLARLPQSVVRAGRVINVRESLRDVITDTDRRDDVKTEVVQTPAVVEMQERMNMPEPDRPVSARDVSTIRVKSEDGKKTFLLRMKFDDTIADLRRFIDCQRPGHVTDYTVMSTFPNRQHRELGATLRESGLTPNATLVLKPGRK